MLKHYDQANQTAAAFAAQQNTPQQNAADVNTCGTAEPDVTIGRAALWHARADAERALRRLRIEWTGMQTERDNHVRRAGALQEQIDRLSSEIAGQERQVHRLSAAVPA